MREKTEQWFGKGVDETSEPIKTLKEILDSVKPENERHAYELLLNENKVFAFQYLIGYGELYDDEDKIISLAKGRLTQGEINKLHDDLNSLLPDIRNDLDRSNIKSFLYALKPELYDVMEGLAFSALGEGTNFGEAGKMKTDRPFLINEKDSIAITLLGQPRMPQGTKVRYVKEKLDDDERFFTHYHGYLIKVVSGLQWIPRTFSELNSIACTHAMEVIGEKNKPFKAIEFRPKGLKEEHGILFPQCYEGMATTIRFSDGEKIVIDYDFSTGGLQVSKKDV